MKQYEVKYTQKLTWKYVVKNPYNEFDIANMSDVCYSHLGKGREQSVVVSAENKEMAKALFAVEIARQNAGCGVPTHPIIVDAYKNILSISEVHADE